MKEIVKVSATNSQLKSKDLATAAATHAAVAVLGYIASRAVVLNSFVPFGLSMIAGCPPMFTPSVAIGVFIGYFIPAIGSGGFQYIAAMFAILAIKLLLSNYTKIVNSPLYLSVICLTANLITSVVTLRGLGANITAQAAEIVLAAGGTYFICKTSQALQKSSAGLSGDEMASLLLVISILLMGITGVNAQGISLSHILGVFLILTAAKYGGTLAGAVSGIVVSFSFSLGNTSTDITTTFAFGGMMAGIFATLGKYAQIGAIIACGFVGAAAHGITVGSIAMIIEISLGATLFLLLPRGLGIYLGKLFSCYPRITAPTGVKKALTMRLTLASNALCDVSETVEQVSRELSRINAPDFSGVISGIEQDACSGCKLRIHCWESKHDDTINAILEMTKAVKNGEISPEVQATEEFKGRCLRITRMGNSVYRHYSDYTAKIAAENRIDEVRSVVSDQFNGISSMLCDLAQDFENEERFDTSAALAAAGALQNIDIHVDECSSRIDKFGRMTLELKLKKNADQVLNKLQMMKLLSLVCERDFDVPNISEVGSDVFITLSEHAAYNVNIGVQQVCASKSTMCGDAYNYFNDGKGHFIMILSDGMGTGGRAAVDGAMASGLMSRLLKAGFGYDCSLRILNSSMLFKSTDESLATVDIASVDLYTGTTELYKAGAAPTLVRRSGRTGKAESTSLPAGILRDIGFDRATIKMRVGDIIILMSDGACSEGTDWIRAELEAWRDGDAEDLADHICECARRRRSDNHEDDITVIAAILQKAV